MSRLKLKTLKSSINICSNLLIKHELNMVSSHQLIFEIFTAFSSVVREKSVLSLISSLLVSVLFTYFQRVVASWEVFQSKTKQVSMIFFKKCQLIVILLMKIQRSKPQFSHKRVSRVSLQTELTNFGQNPPPSSVPAALVGLNLSRR